MRIKARFFLTFILLVYFPSLLALELDETITGRILKTSSSKKTILLNRGSSDQITMGMHAKFSTDTSVVARGVVVELTEARSVWSLYRLATPDLVESDVVLNIKISEPVKLTSDESRSIVRESDMKDLQPNRDDKLSLPLDDIDGEIPIDLLGATVTSADKAFTNPQIELSNYPREIFSRIALQSLESKTSSSNNSTYSGRAEMNNFMVGMEFYFVQKQQWFSNLSILPYFQYQFESMLSYEGSAVDSSLMEIGLAIQYYYLNPNLVNKFNPFVSTYYAVGTIEDSYASGERSAGNGADASLVKGESTSYGVAAGVKYFLENRLVIQALVDYYFRNDKFTYDPQTGNSLWTRDVSGPRVHLGLGYRF